MRPVAPRRRQLLNASRPPSVPGVNWDPRVWGPLFRAPVGSASCFASVCTNGSFAFLAPAVHNGSDTALHWPVGSRGRRLGNTFLHSHTALSNIPPHKPARGAPQYPIDGIPMHLGSRSWFSSAGFFQKLTSAFGSSPPAPLRSGIPQSLTYNKGKAAPSSVRTFEAMQKLEAKGSEFVASLLDREGRQERKQQLLIQSFYFYYIKLLMRKEGMFTFRDFLDFKRGLLRFLQECEEEMGGISRRLGRRLSDMGLKAFKPSESPEFKTFAREIAILECFTEGELEATCPSELGPRAVAAIAASAGVLEKDVKGLLMQFSVLQGDRHWFMRRLEMGKPLPGSFEDRHLLAETDRPFELRLPYGEQFFNYEVQQLQKMLKTRGDGRGDRRRAKHERRMAIKCRLWRPKRREWVDRWMFFPNFFSDPYANFIARRDFAHRQRRRLSPVQEADQSDVATKPSTSWRLLPLGRRMSRRRCRTSLDTLYRRFERRLPKQDPELLELLQRASDADKARRDLAPRQQTGESSVADSGGFKRAPPNSREGGRSPIGL